MVNVLDLIRRNQFIKQLYPARINSLFVGQLELTAFDRVRLTLHVLDKPAIDVAKWGSWGQSYTVVAVELLATGIKQLTIENWQNSQAEPCTVEAALTASGDKRLVLSGTSWKVVLEAALFTFQGTSTYLLNE